MTQTPQRHEVPFDHNSAEHAQECGAANSALHQHGSVMWSPYYDGFWVAVSHAAVTEVELDNSTFSSWHDVTGDVDDRGGVVIPAQPFRAVPIELDPPEYHPYRKLLNPHFSPAAALRWKPFIDGVVDHFLDQMSERGAGDLVLDLANPVPAAVTSAILGLPMDEWQVIAEPAHMTVYAAPGSDTALEAIGKTMQLVGRLTEAIEERAADPRADLLSVLARATIDGEPISTEMAVQMAFLIVFGGVDTTTGLTANALVWLDEHRDHRLRLIEQPDMWPKATEEFLRYFTPVQGQARTVMRDTSVSGCPMSPGDRVLMSFGAANRDPKVFADPDVVDLARTPNRHAAFGLGIHRCLGSNLARVIFHSTMQGVLRRMPDYRVDHEKARRYTSAGIVNGWECVPATWSPTARTGTALPTPLSVVAPATTLD